MFWDYWEQYKFQMMSGALIVILLGIWGGFIIAGQTRVRDITMMSQLKSLASGLESYRRQHADYPVGKNIDLRRAIIIDDSGLTPPSASLGTGPIRRGGSPVYYEGLVTAGKAVYTSDGNDYQISFKLQRTWPVVGARKKSCVIKANYQISCS